MEKQYLTIVLSKDSIVLEGTNERSVRMIDQWRDVAQKLGFSM